MLWILSGQRGTAPITELFYSLMLFIHVCNNLLILCMVDCCNLHMYLSVFFFYLFIFFINIVGAGSTVPVSEDEFPF